MAQYATLKAVIEEVIKTNGNKEITGAILQQSLKAIIDSLGANYQLVGVATPGSSGINPGTPDQNVAYIAGKGSYPNFGGTNIETNQIGIFQYNGAWQYTVIDCGASFEVQEYPGGDAVEFTFYSSDYPDGQIIKINKDVSGLSNAVNEAISQWWAAQKERAINNITGWVITKDTLTTTPSTLGLFTSIESGQIIDSITGVSKLIFGTDGGTNVTVNASDCPYKANANLINVKTESGTANNVSIKVRGVDSPDFINVNDLNASASAYSSATAARNAVPVANRKKGLTITYLLADGWHTEQFIGSNVSDWGNTSNWQLLITEIGPSQIDGEKQSDLIESNLKITFTDGEFKNQTIGTKNININTGYPSLSTIEFDANGGDTILLKLELNVPPANMNSYFIFAVDDTHASIETTDIANHVELIDSDNHIYQLTVPNGTTKFFSTCSIDNKNIVYAKRIAYNKILKWLLVKQANLDPSIIDWIESMVGGTVMPNKIYADNFIFSDEEYIVQNYTNGGYINVTGDKGSDIIIATNDNIHSAIIPCEFGDFLLVKNSQDILPTDTVMARYFYGFGLANQPYKSAIDYSEYPDYIQRVDTGLFLIRIPQDCGVFYLTMRDEERSDDNVKFVIVQQNLKWLKVNKGNIDNAIFNSLFTDIVNYVFSTIKQNNATYHLWDSIKKPIEFQNKTLSAFGDSITAGTASPGLIDAGNNKYISQFCQLTGAILSDYAIGGSCIADNSEYSEQYATYKRIKYENYSDTDIIWIAGGTNDWSTGKPLGTYNSTDVATFYGALRNMCEWLQTNRPNAIVIFVTPIPYTKPESEYPNHIAPLDAYRSAIYDIATEYGFNVVDGNSLGMPREQGNWNNYMCADSDGCHPTIQGHKLYARNLCTKLL